MGHYRKKPIVVEARQFTGDNVDAIVDWIGDKDVAWKLTNVMINNETTSNIISIKTLEGVMNVFPGDWVIRGVKDEYYPCKPDIFDMTYEAVKSK